MKYISASGSETFGMILMEAVGSGLLIVGFDVPYGNQAFIDEGKTAIRFHGIVECLESIMFKIVCKAFLYNHLIFSFQETVHNRDYVADGHIYAAKDVERMIENVRRAMTDGIVLEKYLEIQRKAAFAESVDTYRGLL